MKTIRDIFIGALLFSGVAFASYIIPDGSVSTAKLAANAVTAAKIAVATITATQIASHGITQGLLAPSPTSSASPVPAGGFGISPSSGAGISVSTTTFSTFNNMTVTITGTGRPISVCAQPDGSTGAATLFGFISTGTANNTVAIFRGSTQIATYNIAATSSDQFFTPNFCASDNPGAGIFTYTFQGKLSTVSNLNEISLSFMSLYAYEL